MTRRQDGALLRKKLLDLLNRAEQPITTAQLRDYMEKHSKQCITIEAVYRNLTLLERRGEVHRCRNSGRHARWRQA